mmetsp:Transcript_32780/g.48551  ORF Transcript_32780/g.48551 Transcript_32780/m.48551 type:complete len:83 (+) Transcript_32780:269-517(+)
MRQLFWVAFVIQPELPKYKICTDTKSSTPVSVGSVATLTDDDCGSSPRLRDERLQEHYLRQQQSCESASLLTQSNMIGDTQI